MPQQPVRYITTYAYIYTYKYICTHGHTSYNKPQWLLPIPTTRRIEMLDNARACAATKHTCHCLFVDISIYILPCTPIFDIYITLIMIITPQHIFMSAQSYHNNIIVFSVSGNSPDTPIHHMMRLKKQHDTRQYKI